MKNLFINLDDKDYRDEPIEYVDKSPQVKKRIRHLIDAIEKDYQEHQQ